MDGDNLLQKRRDLVWKMIIQFCCYEYCMEYIHRNELTDKSSRWRIISDILQDLVHHQITENDTHSLYQLLTQFMMKSNKLLEENCFDEQNEVIEECTELLKELCGVSSNLKPMGRHINSLFKNVKNYGLHNNEEEITEWKNVFTGSRMILIKEMLLLLPQPHLLEVVETCNSNCILDTSKNITTAVDLLRSIDFKEEVIHDLKQKLIKDDILAHIMKNSLRKHNYNESTPSPEDSYKTAESTFSAVSSNNQHMDNRKLSKLILLQKQSECEAQSSVKSLRKKERRSVTSSYFAMPQLLPKLNRRKDDSSWKKAHSELKRPLSPTASTGSLRNHTGLARVRMPWTFEEEELLVLGVEKYNIGNWRLILSDGGLENRTVRDLYDKWKNIKKYGHLDAIKTRLRLKDWHKIQAAKQTGFTYTHNMHT